MADGLGAYFNPADEHGWPAATPVGVEEEAALLPQAASAIASRGVTRRGTSLTYGSPFRGCRS
jgi:hypothetical protein